MSPLRKADTRDDAQPELLKAGQGLGAAMRIVASALALLLAFPLSAAAHVTWEGDNTFSCTFAVRRLVTACTGSDETPLPTTTTGNWTFVVTWAAAGPVYENMSVFLGLAGNITQGGATVHGLVQMGRVNGPSPATITLPADARIDEAFFQVSPVQTETQIVFVAPPGTPDQTFHFVLTHAD